MSHIPSSAMPHARAHEDGQGDGVATAVGGVQTQDQPAPEPTTAVPEQPGLAQDGDATLPGDLAMSATDRAFDVAAAGPSTEDAEGGAGEAPLSSAAPAAARGGREGSPAAATAQAAGEPADQAPAVASPVPSHGASNEGAAASGGGAASKLSNRLKPAGFAAIGLGIAAAVVGIVVAGLPLVQGKDEPKSRKRRKKA